MRYCESCNSYLCAELDVHALMAAENEPARSDGKERPTSEHGSSGFQWPHNFIDSCGKIRWTS